MLLKSLPLMVIMMVATAAVALASCGSDADPVEQVVAPAVTQIQQGIDAIDQSRSLACEAQRATLAAAVEAYTMLEDAPPADEGDLVPDWLREESELYDLVDGSIVPAPGSNCAP